jgi:hypothetical protein
LNNNRSNNNNNRRRGRGSNNRQPGGGQPINRIDSRARGNAPQMLEKYRKLAHDAHLNGDRVNEEYFLQFADHYFRVIADTRTRQEEGNKRRDERWQGDDADRDDGDFGSEYGLEGEYRPYDQAPREQSQREPAPRDQNREQGREQNREQAPRREREERPRREPREDRSEGNAPIRAEAQPAQADAEPVNAEVVSNDSAGAEGGDQRSPYEPAENPFVRPTRGLRPRREDRRPRVEADASADENAPTGLDPATLPPAIAPLRDEVAAVEGDQGEEAPKPKRRTRRPRPPVDDAGELEVVS